MYFFTSPIASAQNVVAHQSICSYLSFLQGPTLFSSPLTTTSKLCKTICGPRFSLSNKCEHPSPLQSKKKKNFGFFYPTQIARVTIIITFISIEKSIFEEKFYVHDNFTIPHNKFQIASYYLLFLVVKKYLRSEFGLKLITT